MFKKNPPTTISKKWFRKWVRRSQTGKPILWNFHCLVKWIHFRHTHTREQKTSYRIVFSLFCFAFTVVAANYSKMQRISDAHFRFHHSCWLLKKNTHTHNCELFRKKSEKIEQDQAKMLYVVSQWSISECVAVLVKRKRRSTVHIISRFVTTFGCSNSFSVWIVIFSLLASRVSLLHFVWLA